MATSRRQRNSGYVLLLLLIIWSVSSPAGYGQEYDFKRFSVTEGMPHTQIGVIFQDREDYIWFGTLGGGLARFSGRAFRTYTRADGLRDNVVNAIFEDSHDNFWVSTDNGGVAVLEHDSLRYRFQDSPIDTAAVYNIVESPDGRVWFATYGAGIFIFDGDSLRQLTVKDGLSSNYVWDFWFSGDGTVWMGTHYGLTIYDEAQAEEGARFQTVTDEATLGGYAIYDFYEASDGTLWYVTNQGVGRYEDGTFQSTQSMVNTPLGYTYAIEEDRFGNIWIGTAENGIFRQFGGDEFFHITTANGLGTNWIYDLYKDRHGNMWVGTSEDGASLYRGDTFVQFNQTPEGQSWSVLAVYYTRDNRLLVGTDGRGLWQGVPGRENRMEWKQIGLDGQQVWVIEERSNGNLLLLMDDNRILEYDGTGFADFNRKAGLQPVPYTIDLFVDSKDQVWVGTDSGAYRWDGQRLQQYTEQQGLADNFIWEISEIQNQVWLATNDGLTTFAGDSMISFTAQDGLIHNVVSTLASDKQNELWVGTSGGISHLELQADTTIESIRNFDADDDMRFVDTQTLAIDTSGNLLQGTNAGLQVLNLDGFRRTGRMRVVRFPLGDNDSGIEFTHKAVTADSAGNLWMGTTTGLLKYTPEAFAFADEGPPVSLQDMEINFQERRQLQSNRIARRQGTADASRVSLQYDQNNLRFHFTALEFNHPASVQYRYRLKGFADQWSQPTTVESATFTNLEYRDYEFEVQARNKYGVWGKPAAFAFTIVPPFWDTWWFYLLVVLAAIGVAYTFIRSRIHYLEKQRLSALVDEKTMDLQRALGEKEVLIKEIHHRVKNNLAVISGLLELQLGKTDNDLAEKVLQESQRRVLSISMVHEKLYQNERLSEINFQQYIEELIDIISYSFSHMEKDIVTSVEVKGNVNLTIDQSIPCGLILNELVSNAFEHAFVGRKKGHVDIRFISDGSKVQFEVSDDGVGCTDYEVNGERESLGITLVETLTLQLEGELQVDASPEGTSFIITFQNGADKE